MHLYRCKRKNNGPFLSQIAILIHCSLWLQMTRMEMNYMQLELLLRLTFQVVSVRLQKIDISGHGLLALCKLRLFLLLGV